jgi:positive phototaxis protein PixI
MSNNPTLDRLHQLLPQLFQPVAVSGDSYLRFQLTPEIPALLSMERVQEAILVPANLISPLPNMPEFAIGMMAARERVFCVVDLGQLMGLSSLPMNPRTYQVIVIQAAQTEQCLGLAVGQVSGVKRFESQQLKPWISEVPTSLQRHIDGCFGEVGQEILVLNGGSIAVTASLSTFQNR